jgi:hypothetical protein
MPIEQYIGGSSGASPILMLTTIYRIVDDIIEADFVDADIKDIALFDGKLIAIQLMRAIF